MDTAVKEWVKAAKPVNGPTVVTVTLVDGNLTAKWSVKAYGNIKAGVAEARTKADAIVGEARERVETVIEDRRARGKKADAVAPAAPEAPAA